MSFFSWRRPIFATLLVTGMPVVVMAADAAPSSRPASLPADLPDDLAVWPNKVCYRSSEPWLIEHHDQLKELRPRVLVLNFANDVDLAGIQERTEKLFHAFAESTRYHGFENPSAPAFLKYQAVKYVDMRDRPPPAERAHRNSAFFPVKPDGPRDFNCDYSAFYSDAFARFYGFEDPRNDRRFLNLNELIEAGIVHELWFYAVHEYEKGWPAFEVIEYKQCYDERFQPIAGKHVPAGNGFDDSMPWSGRTFRMAFFNPHRGTGCQMENFGHGLEGISNSEAIPYFHRYFREFAELNLDERYKMPFESLYRMPYDKREVVSYPTKTSMKVKFQGKEYMIDPYINDGGNAHWPPGGRHQYDLESPFTVMSTIENYRMHNGPGGKDKAEEFNKAKFARYRDVAPDCMGSWIVYWRQCMPGLDNKSLDDAGKPMKNWWPFLFY